MAQRSGEKSTFAVTCNLLSQYIKEKGSFADLGGLGMDPAAAPPARAIRPPTTMSLLPGVDVTGDGAADDDVPDPNATRTIDLFPHRAGFGPAVPAADVRAPEKAQLTIFYGGKVLVFDNFPAEKARDLMQLASKGSSTTQNFRFAPPSAAADHPNGPSHGTSVIAPTSINPPTAMQGSAQRPPQPSTSFLPIARKASLHRFLEKRKDRINAKAPYEVNGSAATVKQEESQLWLGLGPQMSKPNVNSECSR